MSVKIDPPLQVIDSRKSASFNCSVSGYPIQSIRWYKNGHPLVKEDRMDTHSDTHLIIHDINRLDQAMYQCIITNENEAAQGTAQLLLGGEWLDLHGIV